MTKSCWFHQKRQKHVDSLSCHVVLGSTLGLGQQKSSPDEAPRPAALESHAKINLLPL